MRKLHLISGLIFLLIFLLTGQYMARVLELANQPLDAQRVMYRAAHIYLLFSALLNIMLGIYWHASQRKPGLLLQRLASLFLVVTQPLFLYAFWQEPQNPAAERSVTLLACVLSFAAVIIHLGIYIHATVFSREHSPPTQ